MPILGVQAAYWEMLDEGRISQTTANILMLSVEEAIDLASHPLCDWKDLKNNVQFPNYYKFLQSGMFPPKLVTYFTVERLESACYICASFLRAHRIARRELHDFIGNNLSLPIFPPFLFIISIPILNLWHISNFMSWSAIF